MLQTLKVLKSAVALHEFTVGQLATHADVGEATVRTVLRRHREWFDQVGEKPTGRRGGRWTIYRTPPATAERIARLMEEHQVVATDRAPEVLPPWPELAEAATTEERLGALEHLLLTAPDAAWSSPGRLDQVARALRSLRTDIESAGTRRLLLRLTTAELLARTIASGEPSRSAEQGEQADQGATSIGRWKELLGDLDDAGLGHVARQVVARIERSRAVEALVFDSAHAVGIELRPFRFHAVIVDAHGRIIEAIHVPLATMDKDAVVEAIADAVSNLITTTLGPAFPRYRVALGLQICGPTNSKMGVVHLLKKRPPEPLVDPPAFAWEEDVPLGDLLRDATGLMTVVENDANAFAVRENLMGAGWETDDFVVMLIREGIGGAVVKGGELFSGPVEIGHFMIHEYGHKVSDAGQPGALETEAGINAIRAQVVTDTRQDVPDIETAVELAETLDPDSLDKKQIIRAFETSARSIARGAAYLINFAGPTHLVLYGPHAMLETHTSAAHAFMNTFEEFREMIAFRAFRDCQLLVRTIDPDDGAQAAAIVALERCLGVSSATQLLTGAEASA